MINALLLAIVVVSINAQNICKKEYNKRGGRGAFTFSAACSFISMIFFIVMLGGRFEYELGVFWYSIVFSVSFTFAMAFSYLAIATGPLSLTALINGYSLIIPTVYGLVALNEPIRVTLFIGIALLVVSLLLVNLKKREDGKRINFKWGVYVTLAFLGNGICSCAQKAQQTVYLGAMKNEFMIVALAITTLSMLTVALISERKTMLNDLRRGIGYYSVSGIANGAVNLFVMVLSASMSASVMFPIMSAGGIIISTLVSLFVYREKLNFAQIVGVLLGIGAIVALNL